MAPPSIDFTDEAFQHLQPRLQEQEREIHALRERAEKAEARAQKAEQTLSALLNHIPEGIAIAGTPEIAIHTLNRHGIEMTGRSPETLTGISADQFPENWQIYHLDGVTLATPDELPLTRAVLRGETVVNEEWILRRPDHTNVVILCNAGPIRDDQDGITGGIVAWRDVTEWKKAGLFLQETLRQKEEALALLDAIFNSAPLGIGFWDRDLRFVRLNNSLAEINGLPVEEHLGRRVDEVLPDPKGIQEIVAAWETILATGQPVLNTEISGSAPSCPGITRYWVENWFPVFLGEKIIGISSTVMDVTERKQAEEALRERDHLVRKIIDSSLNGLYIFNFDQGKHVYINPEYQRLSGYGMDDLSALPEKGVLDLFHPEDRARMAVHFSEVRKVEDGVVLEAECRFRTADGRWIWCLSRDTVYRRHPDGRVAEMIGSFIDITRRRQAEEEIRQRVEEIETLMDLAPVAIWISTDPECRSIIGNREANVIYSVDRHVNVSQTPSPGEITPRFRFFHKGRELPPDELPMQYAAARNCDVKEMEIEFLHPDGTWYAIFGSASPLRDKDGRARGCVGAFMNITSRKQAERQLEDLNQTLEARIEERTRELRHYQEHLRHLASDLTLTEQREKKRLAAELHDYLAQMLVLGKMKLDACRRKESQGEVLAVVQEVQVLLDESLQYTRNLIAELSPQMLEEAGLLAAAHWLAGQMKHHGLDVHVLEMNVYSILKGEKALLLYHTLRELLMNVLKHARVGDAYVLFEERSPDELTITVLDHGRGCSLPERIQDYAAQNHFGLFSIQERIESIGGRFLMISAPNQGTQVVLSVPIDSDCPPSAAE